MSETERFRSHVNSRNILITIGAEESRLSIVFRACKASETIVVEIRLINIISLQNVQHQCSRQPAETLELDFATLEKCLKRSG